MSEDELKDLDRQVKKLKRIASEQAASSTIWSKTNCLPVGRKFPESATISACQAWADANARLQAAQKG
jgi:hypothetical protein